jgi:galactokinase
MSVSFAKDVQPLLDQSCATNGCHKGFAAKEGLALTAGKAYQQLVGVTASQCGDGRQRVKPGAPEESYLIHKLLGTNLCMGSQMPKMGGLSTAAIEVLTAWICNGAKDN